MKNDSFGAFDLSDRKTIPERVADLIVTKIENGFLKPGDKLPSQKELGEMLNVSRPSLREALAALLAMGYLEARRGQGFFVCEALPRSTESGLTRNLSSEESLTSLYEARAAIETAIAYLAALRATDNDIRNLYSKVEAIEKVLPSAAALDESLAFHLALAKSAHNPVLEEADARLLTALQDSQDWLFSEKPSYERDVLLHLRVVQAIEARDPSAAMRAAFHDIDRFAAEIDIEILWRPLLES